MNDDRTISGTDSTDFSEFNANPGEITYTQIVSCAVGDGFDERRRQSLRARLERERHEREQQVQNSFIDTFRNLFSANSHQH